MPLRLRHVSVRAHFKAFFSDQLAYQTQHLCFGAATDSRTRTSGQLAGRVCAPDWGGVHVGQYGCDLRPKRNRRDIQFFGRDKLMGARSDGLLREGRPRESAASVF